ncbi:hypothetical protein GRF59_15215 [Paenibacillus sp. HJL G12]|uniref:Major tail protein n=1 Tax=Paenibacillus dendrobii TaxID=2691084 RepID=A0A7X3IKD1_9BACL|nr:hypothetical protein [Paenibacillus dendrobii]MWV44971.1 hypothetical protein [Paenibacillus dendrobii]
MGAPNVWAIKEVALATFYDLKTEKAKVQLRNLKTAGIENSGETKYAQGGRGNTKVVGFSGNRGGKVTLQDCVFTNEVIAMMTGNDIKTGATNVIQRQELKVVANKATLDYTPVNVTNGLISVYKLNEDGTHGDEITFTKGTVATTNYTLAAKVLSFFASDLEDGSDIVAYYNVATDSTAKTITVSTDKFAGSYKVVLDCLVRNTVNEEDYAAQIVINKAKMEDNWKIDTSADGDPSVFDIPLEMLKPAKGNEMYTMTIYDEALIPNP